MGEINGLPAHVLLVHAVVMVVPLAALCLVLTALWPAARRRLGALPPLLALLGLVLLPLTTSAGEWLERRVPRTELIEEHAELGETLLPWAIGLLVLAVAIWWLDGASGRRASRGVGRFHLEDRTTRAVLGALAVVLALGSVVTTYRIGDSGARAVWEDVVQG